MTRAPSVHGGPSDDGLSLIELIVAMLASVVVLVAVGTILINSWLTQQDVVATTNATNRGQVMGSMIERAMRNARDFEVLPSDTAGTELWVWTSLNDGLVCQGFMLGEPQSKFATSSVAPLPAVANWGGWMDNIRHFADDSANAFFVRTGDTVAYAFEIYDDNAKSAPVQFTGEASMRSTGEEGTSPCGP